MKKLVRIALLILAAALLVLAVILFRASPVPQGDVYSRCGYVDSATADKVRVLACDGAILYTTPAPGLTLGASVDLEIDGGKSPSALDDTIISFAPAAEDYAPRCVWSAEREPCPQHIMDLREDTGEYYSDPVIYTSSTEWYPPDIVPGLTDGQAVRVLIDTRGTDSPDDDRLFSVAPIK